MSSSREGPPVCGAGASLPGIAATRHPVPGAAVAGAGAVAARSVSAGGASSSGAGVGCRRASSTRTFNLTR
jgi:hypothetical protein